MGEVQLLFKSSEKSNTTTENNFKISIHLNERISFHQQLRVPCMKMSEKKRKGCFRLKKRKMAQQHYKKLDITRVRSFCAGCS